VSFDLNQAVPVAAENDMRASILATDKKWRVAAVLLAAALVFYSSRLCAADASLFDALLGSWRGSGIYELEDGTKERISCDAYYTGGGSQLGMAIRCTSEGAKAIEIRSTLSESAGHISGDWEERTYNAEGAASGTVTSSNITLEISGSVTGTMRVSYTRAHQSVSVSTQGVALKSVTVDLNRS
jgi:hypothetical protein